MDELKQRDREMEGGRDMGFRNEEGLEKGAVTVVVEIGQGNGEEVEGKRLREQRILTSFD